MLLSSLVIGFAYFTLVSVLPFSMGYLVDRILIVTSSVVVAYILGRFRRSKFMLPILDFLKIPETGCTCMLDDFIDSEYSVETQIEYEDRVYFGYIHEFEKLTASPHIALCLYTVSDSEGKIIEDNTDDPTKLIILDTSAAKNYIFIYADESAITKDIKQFLPEKK